MVRLGKRAQTPETHSARSPCQIHCAAVPITCKVDATCMHTYTLNQKARTVGLTSQRMDSDQKKVTVLYVLLIYGPEAGRTVVWMCLCVSVSVCSSEWERQCVCVWDTHIFMCGCCPEAHKSLNHHWHPDDQKVSNLAHTLRPAHSQTWRTNHRMRQWRGHQPQTSHCPDRYPKGYKGVCCSLPPPAGGKGVISGDSLCSFTLPAATILGPFV